MGAKYSGLRFGIKEKIAQKVLLRFLKNASKNDKQSSELLNFGYHIVAVKK